MDPSTSAVFHLPELLELILLHLSQKDLLLSQRVCTLFHSTIRDSPRIQKQLFFLPDWTHSRSSHPSITPTTPLSHIHSRPSNNHLILRAFPGCYPTVSLVVATTPTTTTNPTLSFSRPDSHPSWDVSISFPARHKPTRNPSVDYPEASWRKMYLSQPPCKQLFLVRRWQRSASPAVVREGGITMGEFFEEAVAQGGAGERERERGRKGWAASYIGSDRDWHFEGRVDV